MLACTSIEGMQLGNAAKGGVLCHMLSEQRQMMFKEFKQS